MSGLGSRTRPEAKAGFSPRRPPPGNGRVARHGERYAKQGRDLVEVVGEPGVGSRGSIEEFRGGAPANGDAFGDLRRPHSSTPYGALRGLSAGCSASRQGDRSAARQPKSSECAGAGRRGSSPGLLSSVRRWPTYPTPPRRQSSSRSSGLSPRRGHDRAPRTCSYPAVLVVWRTPIGWTRRRASSFGRMRSCGATSVALVLTRRDVVSGFVPLRVRPGSDSNPGRRRATELAQVASDAAVAAPRGGGPGRAIRGATRCSCVSWWLRADAAKHRSLPDSVEAVIAARIDRLSATTVTFFAGSRCSAHVAPIDLLGAVLDEVPRRERQSGRGSREFVARDGRAT